MSEDDEDKGGRKDEDEGEVEDDAGGDDEVEGEAEAKSDADDDSAVADEVETDASSKVDDAADDKDAADDGDAGEDKATGGDDDEDDDDDDEAAADADKKASKADADKGKSDKKDSAKKDKKDKKDKGGGSRWWLLLIAVLFVEFYTYGRNGDIEVCVGKKDVHDFSLIGQERTDENRWKFPRCEARVNLGLRSQYDELVEDATNVACRGATLFRNRGEGPQCAQGTDGWTTQVESSYIWPWDSRYYKHLLWFLFD